MTSNKKSIKRHILDRESSSNNEPPKNSNKSNKRNKSDVLKEQKNDRKQCDSRPNDPKFSNSDPDEKNHYQQKQQKPILIDVDKNDDQISMFIYIVIHFYKKY
ncbi:2647_t:CDS:2 [Funneliformis caledonium]|uniref:2647_t:CDS:1 n=1 Tax=Funneliformis caledonium TaxID=1117310 RepID=A0A9N9AHQ0_9GLOM|nr:2647_t:CDS:2 [Funneliformis caledonium]